MIKYTIFDGKNKETFSGGAEYPPILQIVRVFSLSIEEELNNKYVLLSLKKVAKESAFL